MKNIPLETSHSLYAPDDGAFQNVPVSTTDLCVSMLHPDKVPELETLGQRLAGVDTLALMHGQIENLDFLRSFGSLKRFVCHAAALKDIEGLAHCGKLKSLALGATFSTRPNYRVLRHLSLLERIRLEGPNPKLGFDEAGVLMWVTAVDLYSPKMSLNLLPTVFPNTETLSISQGSYASLEFVATLPKLSSLDIAYARRLSDFAAIGAHPNLQSVKLQCAVSQLKSCNQFGISNSIRRLKLLSCPQLEDISSLASWPALEGVMIERCPALAKDQIKLLEQAGKNVTA